MGRARKGGVVESWGVCSKLLYICRKIEYGTQYNKKKTTEENIEIINIIFRVGACRPQRHSCL